MIRCVNCIIFLFMCEDLEKELYKVNGVTKQGKFILVKNLLVSDFEVHTLHIQISFGIQN